MEKSRRPAIGWSGMACWLLAGLLLGPAATAAAAPPRTVCSATLHAEDEVRALRAHLPEEEFRFVELTELAAQEGAGTDGWLGAACRSGIRCDVLIVSGHFGGSFFGASGHTLGLAELEARACRGDCSGLLRDPREVYLMGCNTAAGKQRDRRTPEAYLQVLREDGVARRSAERIVETRYGALGTSFRARMERVFAGVPHLYGFSSIAPAGPTAAVALERYLEAIGAERPGRYAAHVAGLGAGPGSTNDALAHAFSHTTFSSFSGMSRDGEAAARSELVCALHDEARPPAERLGVVERMAGDDAFLSFVPSIEHFFDAHPRWSLTDAESQAALARLETLAGPRRALLEQLDALRAPTLRSELADVAAQLGWIDPARHRGIARESVIALLDPQVGPEERSAVCELAPVLGGSELSTAELDPETFAEPDAPRARHAAQALLCLEPDDPELRRRMAPALHDEHWRVRARALETFGRLGVDDAAVWAQAAARLSDPQRDVRVEAARALAGPHAPGELALRSLGRALDDPEPAVRAAAIRGLGELPGIGGVADAERMRRLTAALGDDDWQVQFAAASGLAAIAHREAAIDPALLAGVEDALEEALDASSWFVRYKVAETLAQIRTPGSESL